VDVSPRRATPGAAALIAVATLYPVVWILARPSGQPTGRFAAELCGAEAVLLLSCALVLATLLTPIERAFGGLDRVAIWHRRVATAAVVLLVPHVALVGSPADPYETGLGHGLGDVALLGILVVTLWALAPKLRAARWPGPIRALARTSYERWLTAHRLAGLFVAVAVVHGAIVDPVLHRSTPLRVLFLVVGGVGVAAYLYLELIARYVIPIYDYTVAEVRRPNDSTIEVSLEPVGKQLSFTPGQFVVLAFGGENGWQRHPFSIASAPQQHRLEVGIKAAGDYTNTLRERLRAGTPAKLAGPFGGFDYRRGGGRQDECLLNLELVQGQLRLEPEAFGAPHADRVAEVAACGGTDEEEREAERVRDEHAVGREERHRAEEGADERDGDRVAHDARRRPPLKVLCVPLDDARVKLGHHSHSSHRP